MTSINDLRGRITPTPPLPYPGNGAAVPAYAYPGSKPRETLQGSERPLIRQLETALVACGLQVEAVKQCQEQHHVKTQTVTPSLNRQSATVPD
ncbi:Rz1-like lysis system protein LysC [Yersinia aldovae]|uniref:Rz1-like lysis system protein LysC n=1 Tax=Yersinia aldovae TaxID=29483 RepID=UPI0011A04723|nr:Rz1-like lysis system protein LysC [Yersinia aldovae]